jgi:AraC-like DNA-binding protein
MPASPLTDEHWAGLPLLQCNMDPGLYHLDVPTPVLIFREEPGLIVEVPDADGRCVRFRQAPLRFDLFACGVEMNAVSDRPAIRSLVVALPPEWLCVHQALPGEPVELRSMIQFADNELRRLVWRLATHHRGGEPLGAAYSGAVSRTIVDRVMRLQLARDGCHRGAAGLGAEARRLVEALIDADLQDPPSAADMAARVGMGVARFVRAFKATFEASPHQVVQRRRLVRARELLLATDASLTAIALDTGFASHAHFSTVFRAETGTTPSSFRRTRRVETTH